MNTPTKRAVRTILLVILMVSTLTSSALAVPNVSGGFNPDFGELFDEYKDKYGWDEDSMYNLEWDVDYGDETQTWTRRAGYQTSFFQDNVLTTKAYLGMSTGSYGDGSSIVAVALYEAALEDGTNLEVPGGSDLVKYNNWAGAAWCASFVSWCAAQCGLIESGTFTNTASCTAMYDYMVRTMGYESVYTVDTTPFGGGFDVIPGDILFFVDDDGTFGHIGIIVDVDSEYIYAVEGNTTGGGRIPGGGVALNAYRRGSNSRVDRGYVVRVEYPDNKETIFNFLTSELGYNSAAACGVLANIQCESGFDPTIEEVATGIGYGLCQWSFDRRVSLENWCTANGEDFRSLNGQLWYMAHELRTGYLNSTHNRMLSVTNDAEGAYDAGYIWCYYFERPRDYPSVSVTRGNLSRSSYWPIYGLRNDIGA